MKAFLCLMLMAAAAPAGELCFELHAYPRTEDPLLASEESAEAVKYLTEGVLVRVNRRTQALDPELAESWTVEDGGRRIRFHLRAGVRFPDGKPLTAADVEATFQRLLDPALHAPAAETFRTSKGTVRVRAAGPREVVAEFPSAEPDVARLFDQVPVMEAGARGASPGLGPFLVAARRPGVSILLKRNPYYWKRDEHGRPLPRVDSIRLEVDANRDMELLRFRQGQLQLIEKLTPELYERLKRMDAGAARDAGPSLDVEFLWFNLDPGAPLRAEAKGWFAGVEFRRAVSSAIERQDLARVVYRGYARPAAALVSPANRMWFDTSLAPEAYDPKGALQRLAQAGFRFDGQRLRDASGKAVEFSILTNAGSETRERMAAMIQQDLAKIGIAVHVVTLDFPSLIERISRSRDYEVCLLGLVNVEPDPSEMMNVLLSSAGNHPWHPSEPRPQTAWEAEIDRLMMAQAGESRYEVRRREFARVQEILHEQAPLIPLLHPDALMAISPRLAAAEPSAFFPHSFWDAERIAFAGPGAN